jgi:murein DD-endopeptidase MepM/ murein hydrolase activator NlpD
VSRILFYAVPTALLMALSGGPVAMLHSGGPMATPVALQDRSVAQPDGPDTAPSGAFGWPLPGSPPVVRAFEAPIHRFGPGHRGVDLAGQAGTPVLAAGDGTVVFAGQVAGREVISIDHPGGLRTTYEPVSPRVTAGDLVTAGEQIGVLLAGHPGCPVVSCLHWGVRRGMAYLDPLRLLEPAHLRLLPWESSADGT